MIPGKLPTWADIRTMEISQRQQMDSSLGSQYKAAHADPALPHRHALSQRISDSFPTTCRGCLRVVRKTRDKWYMSSSRLYSNLVDHNLAMFSSTSKTYA